MRKFILRSLLAVLFIAVYFFVIREVRIWLNLLVSEYSEGLEILPNLKVITFKTRLWIYQYSGELLNIYTYKILFGYYFLLGFIGLTYIARDFKPYILLSIIHFVLSLICLLSLIYGLTYNANFLIITDAIVRYLIPVFSLGIVALLPIWYRKIDLINHEK